MVLSESCCVQYVEVNREPKHVAASYLGHPIAPPSGFVSAMEQLNGLIIVSHQAVQVGHIVPLPIDDIANNFITKSEFFLCGGLLFLANVDTRFQ